MSWSDHEFDDCRFCGMCLSLCQCESCDECGEESVDFYAMPKACRRCGHVVAEEQEEINETTSNTEAA